MVGLTIDASQLRKVKQTLAGIKDGVPRALAPAINRALDKGRTEVRRGIRNEYLIKSKDIPIKVRGANRATLTGKIVITDKMMALGKFKVTPRGVALGFRRRQILRAQVKKKGSGGSLPSAFNAAVPGYVGPFVRKGAARLPIRRLLTISAPIMASQPAVGPVVNKAMGDTLANRIDHEMNRVLASAGGHT